MLGKVKAPTAGWHDDMLLGPTAVQEAHLVCAPRHETNLLRRAVRDAAPCTLHASSNQDLHDSENWCKISSSEIDELPLKHLFLQQWPTQLMTGLFCNLLPQKLFYWMF